MNAIPIAGDRTKIRLVLFSMLAVAITVAVWRTGLIGIPVLLPN